MIAFVRHGQTAVNREGRLQGRADASLTALGRAQAVAVAGALGDTAVRRVVSSPLRRAVETAEVVAAAHGAELQLDDRLVELDYGEWDRLPLRDIPSAAWATWRDDPHFSPPGGESLVDVTARVSSFVSEIVEEELVVAVSHVSPIKAAVCWALEVDERITWRMHLELASVTRLARRPDGLPYLASFNETAHLLGVDPID